MSTEGKHVIYSTLYRNHSDRADNVVRTFWHGGDLSLWEHLSLKSLLKAGHEVEVYAFDDLNVPTGVKLCNAEEVMPRSEAFAYKHGMAKGSFAACSNRFRYALLYRKGGIWADADVLCLKSLADLPNATIGWENHDSVNGAVMKFSAGHPAMLELLERSTALGENIRLGEAGPWLLTKLVQERRHKLNIMPIRAFYPIHWSEAWKLAHPDSMETCLTETTGSHCVHWWNGALRALGYSRDCLPPDGSFLGTHARRLLSPTAAPDDIPKYPDPLGQPLDPFAEECRHDVLKLERLLTQLEDRCGKFGVNLNIALAERLAWWRARLDEATDGHKP